MGTPNNPPKIGPRDTTRHATSQRDDAGVTTPPVTVWHLADSTTQADTTFAARLSRRLVLTYTRRGELVIDFDADTTIRDTVARTARHHVAIISPADIADLDTAPTGSCLIMLRWPRTTSIATSAGIKDLLLACRLIAATAPTTLAISSEIQPRQVTTSDKAETVGLLAAATTAGFHRDLHIVALASTGDSDRFVYHADDTDIASVLDAWRTTARPGRRVDILRHTGATP